MDGIPFSKRIYPPFSPWHTWQSLLAGCVIPGLVQNAIIIAAAHAEQVIAASIHR